MFWRFRRATMNEQMAAASAVSTVSAELQNLNSSGGGMDNHNNQTDLQKMNSMFGSIAHFDSIVADSVYEFNDGSAGGGGGHGGHGGGVSDAANTHIISQIAKGMNSHKIGEISVFPVLKINTGLEVKGLDISRDGRILACTCYDDEEDEGNPELQLYFDDNLKWTFKTHHLKYQSNGWCVCVCVCVPN